MGAGKSTLGPELAATTRQAVRLGRRRGRGADRRVDRRSLRGSGPGGLPRDRGARGDRGPDPARAGRRGSRRRSAGIRGDADRAGRARLHAAARDDAGGGVGARRLGRQAARNRPRGVRGALRRADAGVRGSRRRPRARPRRRRAGGRGRARLEWGPRRARDADSGRAEEWSSWSTHSVDAVHGDRARQALGDRLAAAHVVPGGRAGEDGRGGGSAVVGAPPRARRHAGGARRRLDDRPDGVRRGHVPPRRRLGAGADHPRRPGGRGDRREGRDRPPRGEEPRGRVPLAGARRDRPGAARPRSRTRSWSTGEPRS